MSAAVQVPIWAAYAVSVGTPVITFVGVLIAQWITRKGSRELETRSKREETMRNLRWAAELVISEDRDKARLGLGELRALGDSNMLSDEEQLFIDAALAAVVKEPVDEITEDEARGIPAAIVRIAGIRASTAPLPPVVPSEEETPDEGGE